MSYEVRIRYSNGSETIKDYNEDILTVNEVMRLAAGDKVAFVKIYDNDGTWLYSVWGKDNKVS